MNSINGRFGTWQGPRVSCEDLPEQIADDLVAMAIVDPELDEELDI